VERWLHDHPAARAVDAPARTAGTTPAPLPVTSRPSAWRPGRSIPGLGFDSPLGHFANVGGGVLLAGSASTAAGVSLVLPSGLVALAALVGLVAVLAQRRVDRRRRVLR
jgi:hypothetical protein